MRVVVDDYDFAVFLESDDAEFVLQLKLLHEGVGGFERVDQEVIESGKVDVGEVADGVAEVVD